MKEKIFTKNFWFSFLALFSSSLVMFMLMTTITEYATTFNANDALAGLASGLYVIGGLCSRLFAGSALERVGWKKLGLIFLSVHFIACCCYFFVSNLAMLLIVRFVHGLGFGAGTSAMMTMGMSILPKSRYSEATGYFMLATTLSIAIGPFIGGFVYDSFGATGCFTIAVVLSILVIIFTACIDVRGIDPCGKTERTAPTAKGLNSVLEVKALPISFCIFLFAFGYVSVMSFYRLYAAETNLTAVFPYFFIIYSVILVFSRPLAGKLQDKYGDNIVCYPGLLLQTIGLVLLAWKPCFLTIVICAFGCALGYGTLNSCCNAIVCKNVSDERRSYAVTSFWVFCDGGMGLGPALLGLVSTELGYAAMYYAAAGITVFSIFIYFLVWGRKQKTFISLPIKRQS